MRLGRATERLVRWLDDTLRTLNHRDSADVHIDQLVDGSLTPEEQVDMAVRLFEWGLSNVGDKLLGKIMMLVVPLQNSGALDRQVPTYEALALQLGKTPASIYVMDVRAYLQADTSLRYTAEARIPTLEGRGLSVYYQCWRSPDDPEEDGWARDVRVVAAQF